MSTFNPSSISVPASKQLAFAASIIAAYPKQLLDCLPCPQSSETAFSEALRFLLQSAYGAKPLILPTCALITALSCAQTPREKTAIMALIWAVRCVNAALAAEEDAGPHGNLRDYYMKALANARKAAMATFMGCKAESQIKIEIDTALNGNSVPG